MKKYVILGATGHTGKPVAIGLLAQRNAVRVVTRDASRAADLAAMGAEVMVGESNDTALLKKAFAGYDAAYLLIPALYTSTDFSAAQAAYTKAFVEALQGSSIKHVVTLSSVGAHLPQGAGVVQGLQHMETKLNELSGINILHLRASYFLENTLGMAGMVKHMGIMGSPLRSDVKMPMVATSDIANVALGQLTELNFTGKQHKYVLGARDYTYNEIAAIYGAAIGKPDLKYVQFSYEDAQKGMTGAGMSESTAIRMNEFVKAANEGRVLEDVQRDASNTTPLTAEQFAQVFKSVYENS